MLAIYIILLYT